MLIKSRNIPREILELNKQTKLKPNSLRIEEIIYSKVKTSGIIYVIKSCAVGFFLFFHTITVTESTSIWLLKEQTNSLNTVYMIRLKAWFCQIWFSYHIIWTDSRCSFRNNMKVNDFSFHFLINYFFIVVQDVNLKRMIFLFAFLWISPLLSYKMLILKQSGRSDGRMDVQLRLISPFLSWFGVMCWVELRRWTLFEENSFSTDRRDPASATHAQMQTVAAAFNKAPLRDGTGRAGGGWERGREGTLLAHL